MLYHVLRQRIAPAYQVFPSRYVLNFGSCTNDCPLQTPSQWCFIAWKLLLQSAPAKCNHASMGSMTHLQRQCRKHITMRSIELSGACISGCRVEGAYHRVRHVLRGYVPLGVGVAQRKEAVRVLQTAWWNHGTLEGPPSLSQISCFLRPQTP